MANEIEKNTSDCKSFLVKLIIDQGHVYQGWVKFLILIESGLFMSLGFILKIQETVIPIQVLHICFLAIPIFGIFVVWVLRAIIFREKRWQNYYVSQFAVLNPDVFPKKDVIKEQKIGYISRIIKIITRFLVIGWVIIFFVFFYYFYLI